MKLRHITESIDYATIWQNQDFLNKLQQFGVNIRIPPKADSHRGPHGQVFYIGDKAIKITANANEAKLAEIYAAKVPEYVAVLGVFPVDNYYCIVQKKLDKVGWVYDQPFDAVKNYIWQTPRNELAIAFQSVPDDKIYQLLEIKAKTIPVITYHLERIETEEQMLALSYIWKLLREIYAKTGYIVSDLKSENFGFDGELLKIIDLDEVKR